MIVTQPLFKHDFSVLSNVCFSDLLPWKNNVKIGRLIWAATDTEKFNRIFKNLSKKVTS